AHPAKCPALDIGADPMFGRPVEETTQDEERQAEEEDIEHRLLNQRVEEDGGRIEREAKSSDEPRASREQPFGGHAERCAGESADDRLADPDHEQIAPE